MKPDQIVKPSLTALAFVLRNWELWPPGFRWNYDYCETCALGMARKLWPASALAIADFRSSADALAVAAEQFKLSAGEAERIFCAFPDNDEKVTPEMVAARIEAMGG